MRTIAVATYHYQPHSNSIARVVKKANSFNPQATLYQIYEWIQEDQAKLPALGELVKLELIMEH